MKSWPWDLALFVLASPILLCRAASQAFRKLQVLGMAKDPVTICRTCGGQIWLVGFWRCSCGFTYQGHLLRVCPICQSFPRMLRCYRCGATQLVATCD